MSTLLPRTTNGNCCGLVGLACLRNSSRQLSRSSNDLLLLTCAVRGQMGRATPYGLGDRTQTHVVAEDAAVGPPVECDPERLEALLPRRIPDLRGGTRSKVGSGPTGDDLLEF